MSRPKRYAEHLLPKVAENRLKAAAMSQSVTYMGKQIRTLVAARSRLEKKLSAKKALVIRWSDEVTGLVEKGETVLAVRLNAKVGKFVIQCTELSDKVAEVTLKIGRLTTERGRLSSQATRLSKCSRLGRQRKSLKNKDSGAGVV